MNLPLLVLPSLAFVTWLAWRGGWLRAGAWFALAVLGQACALSLYRAGPVVSYHHYRPPEDATRLWIATVPIVLQAALVCVALARRAGALRAWTAQHFRAWQLALVALLFAVTSAKLSRPAETSALEFAFASAVQLLGFATLGLAAWSLPERSLAAFRGSWERTFGPSTGDPEPGGLDRFAWTISAAVTIVCALLAVFVYERHPHVPDEVVYLIQAKYLAQGRLSLAVPPVPEAFDVDLMLRLGERWFSPVLPGWPFVLALGAFFGVPWLVDPLLSGAAILLAYLLVRELADRRTARICVALLALSPWFLFLGMSFMTHTWTLVCALLAALGVARAKRTASLGWAALGGAGIGAVSLVRPLEGLVLAGLLGAWAIGLGGSRMRWAPLVALVAVTGLVAALVLPYDRALTGAAWPPPINVYVDTVYGPGKNDLGFGANRGLGWDGLDPWPGHTPFQALVNAQFNAFAIQSELFGWASGSLWLALLALVWSRRNRLDAWMWVAFSAIVAANSLYWFSGGPDFGARYWFLSIVPLVVLTAGGLSELERRLGRDAVRAELAVLALCCASVLTFLPWRALDKYVHYRGMDGSLRALARDFGTGLVLVQGERHPDYASAAVENPADWDAPAPIYAWDRDGETRRRVLEHYRDRQVWIVAGPTRTHTGFQVVEGPISAEALLARAREEAPPREGSKQ
jgi:dolichyl-phosphate-mannose-protein mannosyltransferase